MYLSNSNSHHFGTVADGNRLVVVDLTTLDANQKAKNSLKTNTKLSKKNEKNEFWGLRIVNSSIFGIRFLSILEMTGRMTKGNDIQLDNCRSVLKTFSQISCISFPIFACNFNVFPTRLFKLDDAEIVLVVDDDTIAMKLAGLASALPKQVFL